MKCRLIQNTYLTVISLSSQHYNRHFEAGAEFERLGRTIEGDWILKCDDLRLFATREKMGKCFEFEYQKINIGSGKWRLKDEN